MSLYVSWMNRIKTDATRDWLTPGQRVAFEALVSKWQVTPFVALVGPEGSGKSFIARLLHTQCGYVYAHEVGEIPPETENAIVDANEYHRLWRPIARELNVKRIVWTLRAPPPAAEAMPEASIVLHDADRKQFQARLSQAGIVPSWHDHSGLDFGLMLRLEAMSRAEKMDAEAPALNLLTATPETSPRPVAAGEDGLDDLF